MIYIGIDPGLHGAIAVLSSEGELVEIIDAPVTNIGTKGKVKNVYVESSIVSFFEKYKDAIVGIEKQQAMTKQGVTSTFQTGYGFGMYIGMISALHMPTHIITPQKWKKEMMYGMGKEKSASCIKAQQLFPNAELFTPRGRALDGRADALLIATYLKTIL